MPTKIWSKTHYMARQFLQNVPTQAGNDSYSIPVPIVCPQQRTGVSNPKWKTIVKSAGDATTPMSGSFQNFECKPMAYTLSWVWPPPANGQVYNLNGIITTSGFPRNSGFSIFQNHPINFATDAALVAEAKAKAIKALYKKIREVRSQFAGGLFLAELRKTVRMIARPAKALQDGMLAHTRKITKIVNGRNVNIKGKTKKWTLSEKRQLISSSYLEGVFGWQPLLSDIKDAAIALARLLAEKKQQRFRAFGQAEKMISLTPLYFSQQGLPFLHQSVLVKQTALCVYYGAFQGQADDERLDVTIERVVDLSGVSLRDILPTAWEILPWSFLADYFLNIGEILEAFSTDTSVVKRLARVDIEENLTRMDCRVDFPATAARIKVLYGGAKSITQTGSASWYELTLRTVSRVPTSVPFPTPRFEVPDLFSKHSLNIAALAAGARPSRL